MTLRSAALLAVVVVCAGCRHQAVVCDYVTTAPCDHAGRYTCDCRGEVRPPNEEERSLAAIGGAPLCGGPITYCEGSVVRANVPLPSDDRDGDAGACSDAGAR